MSKLILSLVILLIVSACAPTAPETPNIIIVPNETQAAIEAMQNAATPLPTPTATLAPTPTIPPADLLDAANRAARLGDADDAIALYAQVTGAPESRDSLFALGATALRAGLFEQAVNAFSTFISAYPDDPRIMQAVFLRGDALLGVSRWGDAILDYQAYLAARPGLIDSYAHERIGDAQLALGQADAALTSYAAALEAPRGLVPSLQLREKLAQVYIATGQVSQAVLQYDTILATARNAPYRASIAYAAARALLDAGDIPTALARLQGVFEEFPDRPQAYAAMSALLQNGVTLDGFQEGQVRFAFGDYGGAIDAYNTYTTRRPLVNVPPQLYLQLGRAYREIGNTAAALTAFETVIDLFPTDPAFGDALLEQGRTRFLADEIQAAIGQYMTLVDTYGYLPQAPEALFRAAYLYGTTGDAENAAALFGRLASAYPDSDQANIGLLLAGATALQAGNDGSADQAYAALAAQDAGDLSAEAYLSVGRLALRRGDGQIAALAFERAAAGGAETYFGLRAADIQAGRAPFAPPAALTMDIDESTARAEAEAWLRATFALAQDAPLATLSPALLGDPRLIRGRELWTLGAYSDAREEFGALVQTYAGDAAASYGLAILFRETGAYTYSIRAAGSVIAAAGVRTTDAPRFLARLRYPLYYRERVEAEAAQYGIDPLLLFALILHESVFDANATAGAGEIGLTQVIPATGQYIADGLGRTDYQHSDLFNPRESIAFGAYYLHEQLEDFAGNVPAALAAYNAGPGRTRQWVALAGDSPELTLTTITVANTRTYVQRIYANYAMYRAIYGNST
jgi:soluble lytic murein transglycosylase